MEDTEGGVGVLPSDKSVGSISENVSDPSFDFIHFEQVLNDSNELDEHLVSVFEVLEAKDPLDDQRLQRLSETVERCLSSSTLKVNEDIARSGVIFLGSMPDLNRQFSSLADNISKLILKVGALYHPNIIALSKIFIESRGVSCDSLGFLFAQFHHLYSDNFHEHRNIISNCIEYLLRDVNDINTVYHTCLRFLHWSKYMFDLRPVLWIPGIVAAVCVSSEWKKFEKKTLINRLLQELAKSLVCDGPVMIELHQILVFLLMLCLRLDMLNSLPLLTSSFLLNYVKSIAAKQSEDDLLLQIFLVNSIVAMQIMIGEQSMITDGIITESLRLARSLLPLAPDESILKILKINLETLEKYKAAVGFKLHLTWRKFLKIVKALQLTERVPQHNTTLAIKDTERPKFIGLRNTSYNCYLNAVLQMLHHHTTFRRAFDSICGEGSVGKKGVIHRTLRSLFESLADTLRNKAVDPSIFANLTRPEYFLAGTQQDAVEYLDHLLELLRREAIELGGDDSSSYVSKVFGIPVICTHSCAKCNRELIRTEDTYPFLMLHLRSTVPQTDGEVSDQLARQTTQEMIESLCTERIDDTERCEYCEGEGETFARNVVTEIKTPPSTLLLNIKIFQFDKESRTAFKNLSKFEVNEVLTLKIKGDKKCHYQLWGIILHLGKSTYEGHYTWVCKLEDRWILFNDEKTSAVNLRELLENKFISPYLIVYVPKND